MTNLDIVIVNWNAGSKLYECLESIRHSRSGPSFHLAKCIVVDNASTDNSLDQIRDVDLPLELILNTENQGFGFACNQGARPGSSEYLLFLNPDVRLFADSLSGSVAFMETGPEDKIGILGIQMIDQHGNVQRNVARFPSTASLFHQMIGLDRIWPGRFPPHFMTDWTHLDSRIVDQVPGAFFLIRRSLFENLQGFDERFFMYYEDLDLACRARKAGWASYYLASVRAFHQGGGTTEQVKARRLFYVLCSRILYAAKHFGYRYALWIMMASIAFELWIRLAWNIVHLSARDLQGTLQAYFLYIKELPALLKKIRK